MSWAPTEWAGLKCCPRARPHIEGEEDAPSPEILPSAILGGPEFSQCITTMVRLWWRATGLISQMGIRDPERLSALHKGTQLGSAGTGFKSRQPGFSRQPQPPPWAAFHPVSCPFQPWLLRLCPRVTTCSRCSLEVGPMESIFMCHLPGRHTLCTCP